MSEDELLGKGAHSVEYVATGNKAEDEKRRRAAMEREKKHGGAHTEEELK